MATVELAQPPGDLVVLLRALAGTRKAPGRVKKLPRMTWVRPEVVVDGAHVARYAELCGLPAGAQAQQVPLLYPQLLTFPLVMAWATSPECPWPALGTVHLANVVEQHVPLQPGQPVRVELSTGELLAHEKGQAYTLHLRVVRGDETVWTATQTLLRLGALPATGRPFEPVVPADAPLSRQAEFDAPADIGRRYGAVSGDRNPIHLTPLTARLFGFRRAIAHGMWTQARALSAVLPAAPLEAARLAVDFKAPVLLPARLSLWSARTRRRADFEVRDARGQRVHLRAQLTC